MTYLDGFNEAKEAAANWLRRQANTEMDNSKRMAFIEAHNATLALQPPEIELVQKMHKLGSSWEELRQAVVKLMQWDVAGMDPEFVNDWRAVHSALSFPPHSRDASDVARPSTPPTSVARPHGSGVGTINLPPTERTT